ncbi:hypothetical protein WIS52_27710 [Pseudonocardia nematodicida]|uniref:Lipoprotein n=1 Tax=Pseudonocardia nematodicida TaxID=1206997 RepID=A0ABV1KIJ7_9PSEU
MGARCGNGTRRRVAVAGAVLVALALAGGCGGPDTIERDPASRPAGSAPGDPAGLEALQTKFGFYARDTCYSGDPAEVYSRCGRFATEVRNALPQVERDAPAAAGRAAATAEVLDRFAASGCEPPPGTAGGGDPATCGPLFGEVQGQVQELVGAVGTRD